jgi:hypothetical protein
MRAATTHSTMYALLEGVRSISRNVGDGQGLVSVGTSTEKTNTLLAAVMLGLIRGQEPIRQLYGWSGYTPWVLAAEKASRYAWTILPKEPDPDGASPTSD